MHASIDGQYFYKDRTLKSVNFFNSEPGSNVLSVYEVFRVEETVPLFLTDHLRRLQNSAKIANVNIKKTNSQIKQVVRTLIAANSIEDGNIKIDIRLHPSGEKEFLVHFVQAHYPESEEQEDGVAVCIQDAERNQPAAKIYNAKVRGEANSIIDKKHVYETLLLNKNGLLTEGSRSNLFFIKNNEIVSAPDQLVLPGIIRSKVLELITRKKLSLHLDALPKEELSNIDAAFLTGTSSRILPIKAIDDIVLNTKHQLILELRQDLLECVEIYKKEHK